MPYKLKIKQVSFRDPDAEDYEDVDVIAEQTKAGLVTEIQQAGATEKSEISTLSATEKSAITTLGDGKVTEIEETGAEVLDSIPADYTALSEDVDDLKSAFYALGLSVVGGAINITYDDGN